MKKNILLGVNSGIGAKDTVELVKSLLEKFDVKVVTSKHSESFFDLDAVSQIVPVFDDESEWYNWEKRGDDILHITLRNWADAFLIAPLSANTLAKLANGIADNLLLTIARAWIFNNKSFVVAPSMNRFMWEHPVTREHLSKLFGWGIKEIPPRCKLLAGGDFGVGALQKSNIITQFMHEIVQDEK